MAQASASHGKSAPLAPERERAGSKADDGRDTCAVFTVDDAVEAIGFGFFHVKLALFSGLIFMMDSMEIMALAFLSGAARCYFDLSTLEVAFISAVVFLGMLIGSQPYGWMMDRYGRRQGLLVGIIFIGVFGVSTAFAPSYPWLLILRFLVGVNLSSVPLSLAYFLEFVPARHRSKSVVFVSVWWSIGTIFEALLAMAVMPSLGWRYLLGLSATPLLIILAFFPTLPESPRFLMVNGQPGRARLVLEKIAKSKGVSLPEGQLVLPQEKEEREIKQLPISDEDELPQEVRHEAVAAVTRVPIWKGSADMLPLISSSPMDEGQYRQNPFDSDRNTSSPTDPVSAGTSISEDVYIRKSSDAADAPIPEYTGRVERPTFRDLFSSRAMVRTTLGLWWIWFSSAFIYYGVILITGQVLSSASGACQAPPSNSSAPAHCLLTLSQYTQVMWTSVAEIPGLITAFGMLCFLGRRTSLALLLFGTTVTYALLFWCGAGQVGTLLIVFVVRACINGAYQVIFVYTAELYPTRTRALGVATCTTVSRVGSIITSFVAEIILAESMAEGKAIYTAFAFLTCLVTLQLPLETRNKALV